MNVWDMRTHKEDMSSHKIAILPNPIAAAIYYASITDEATDICLVLDLESHSLNATLLTKNREITSENPYPYRVCTYQNEYGGSYQIDEALAELILKKVESSMPTPNLPWFGNKDFQTVSQLIEQLRSVKESFNEVESVDVMLAGNFGVSTVTITRSEYEGAITPYIRRIAADAERVLQTAKVLGSPRLTILLVGADCCLLLRAQEMLKERFTWLPEEKFLLNAPDRAIALGREIYAEQATHKKRLVCEYGIKVEDDGKEYIQTIIPSNVVLPYYESLLYDTTADHNFVSFQLLEIHDEIECGLMEDGEKAYREIRLDHDFGRTVPKGTEVLIRIDISADGVLSMTCDDGGISDNSVSTVTRTLSCKTI